VRRGEREEGRKVGEERGGRWVRRGEGDGEEEEGG